MIEFVLGLILGFFIGSNPNGIRVFKCKRCGEKTNNPLHMHSVNKKGEADE